MPHSPRPYQSAAIESLRSNFAAGTQRQLLVAPTGAGKTTIAAIIIDGAMRKKKRTWFLAHRQELINQCSARLDDHGVAHGVIQASHPRFKPWLPVQVVSVHTIVRGQRLEKVDAAGEGPDLIIIDEAHRSLAESYMKVVERYPKAAVIGLTATPWRLDGKPLGDRYERLVVVAKPQDLIDTGFLLAPRVFAPSKPDLSGVRKTGGDYRNDDLAARMKTATIVGDVVSHWRTHVLPSGNPLTVLFAVNKAHSIMMRDRFIEDGIPAAHIDESSTAKERSEILQDLSTGKVKVVCNCQILTEGWDLPQLGAVVLCRPTQSLALYLQMAGRGMRTHTDKDGWLLMDHAGCVMEHGFPQDDREYSLDAPAERKKRGDKESGPSVTVCESCFAIFESALRICPECKTERKVVGRSVEEDKAGVLTELSQTDAQKMRARFARQIPWELRSNRLATFIATAKDKGYKLAWAYFKFKDDVGMWPPKKMQTEALFRLGLTEEGFDERRKDQPDAPSDHEGGLWSTGLPAERREAPGQERAMDPIQRSGDG